MTIDARLKAYAEAHRKAVADAVWFGLPPDPGLAGMFSPAEPTPIAPSPFREPFIDGLTEGEDS